MTPQSLKSAILQLAIQGKLVPQRPEDGVARVPAALNTEKRKARRHGEEMESPFEIPGNWRWVRLGQLFDIARGGSPRPIKAFLTTEENGLNWIKIGDTDKNSKYINSCREKIIPSGLSKTRQVFKGDLLLTNSMSFGHPYILNIDGCIHDGWPVLHPASPELFKDFFFYLLSSPVVFKQFQTAAAGAVVQNLNSDKVAQTLVPLPPLPEQHRIVAKIEELLPLVDRYEQAWTKLEDFNRRFPADMQKSLLQMAIQGQLVEQRPEEGTAQVPAAPNTEKKKARRHGEEIELPFEIPGSWRWVRLGDIAESVNVGIVIQPKRYYVSQGEGTPAFRNCNIQQGFINDREWVYLNPAAAQDNPRAVVKSGDVLIARSGTPGNCCVVPQEYNGRGAVDIVIVRLQPELADSQYIKTFICAPTTQKAFMSLSRGVALAHLGATAVASQFVPLPPLAEQKRIVAKLEELLPLCERLK